MRTKKSEKEFIIWVTSELLAYELSVYDKLGFHIDDDMVDKVYSMVFTHMYHQQYKKEIIKHGLEILKNKYAIVGIPRKQKDRITDIKHRNEKMKQHPIPETIIENYYHLYNLLLDRNLIKKN